MKKFKGLKSGLLAVLLLSLSVSILFVGCQQSPPEEPQADMVQDEAAPDESIAEADNDTSAEMDSEPERLTDQPADEVTFVEKLHDLLLGAKDFYEDSHEQAPLITQNARLYNATAYIQITPEYLAQRGYIGEAYLLPDSDVLYLSPQQMSDAVADFNITGDAPVLFSAAKMDAGYSIVTQGHGMFNATNEEYAALMEKFNSTHGEVRRITGSTDDYDQINSAIGRHEGTIDEYYIRYGMRDDKYAIVVASPKDEYTQIKGFVIELDGNNPRGDVMGGIEKMADSKVEINHAFPDLNKSLIPPYELSKEIKKLSHDYEGMEDALVNDGYITAEEAKHLKYVSGNREYMFAKFENNQMFVGVSESGVWILGEVDSPENARNRLIGLDPQAPDFIIIWE